MSSMEAVVVRLSTEMQERLRYGIEGEWYVAWLENDRIARVLEYPTINRMIPPIVISEEEARQKARIPIRKEESMYEVSWHVEPEDIRRAIASEAEQ